MTIDPDILAIQRQRRQQGRCLACGKHTPRAALCVGCRKTLAYCPTCERLYTRRAALDASRATEYCSECRAQQYLHKKAGLPPRIVEQPARPACAAPKCAKPVTGYSRWCKMHHARYKRHGDPTITLLPRRTKQPPDPRPTIAQVAVQLGVSGRRVQALIDSGRLTGEKVGKGWRIDPASVEVYAVNPRRRRPGKEHSSISSLVALQEAPGATEQRSLDFVPGSV